MGKRKGTFNLEKEFLESVKFIKEIKKFIWIISGLFFVFLIFGFFVPIPEELAQKLMDYFKDLIGMTEGFNSLEMILFLFNNNLLASFFGLIFGVFFGIFPIVNSVMNGFVLGYAAKLAMEKSGIFVLWRLFPHGIFELPALIISLSLGLKISTFIFEKNKKKAFREFMLKCLKAFVLIVVPLLVIAAIIEGLLITWGV